MLSGAACWRVGRCGVTANSPASTSRSGCPIVATARGPYRHGEKSCVCIRKHNLRRHDDQVTPLSSIARQCLLPLPRVAAGEGSSVPGMRAPSSGVAAACHMLCSTDKQLRARLIAAEAVETSVADPQSSGLGRCFFLSSLHPLAHATPQWL